MIKEELYLYYSELPTPDLIRRFFEKAELISNFYETMDTAESKKIQNYAIRMSVISLAVAERLDK